MKRLSVVAISIFSLVALSGVARADQPARQEGRVWYDQNLTLAFTPEWSFTVMPGVRTEFARSREDLAGVQFLEFFIGPNYTYRMGNLTLKGSIWYYYMGYPQRGRMQEKTPYAPLVCSNNPLAGVYCASTYNFSHNLEIIPAAEYRLGRWSFYDRVIFHNTFYADIYNNTNPATNAGLSVNDERYGWGTVLRELAQVRYALTDRLGVLLADEVFFGIIEDSDTKKLSAINDAGKAAAGAGYNVLGYWKDGFRQNRVYLGIDYKVTPALTVTPMYMLEVDVDRLNSSDVTDMSHNLFIIVTYVAKMFEDKK
jgi:hypothetical protein